MDLSGAGSGEALRSVLLVGLLLDYAAANVGVLEITLSIRFACVNDDDAAAG